MNAIKSRAYSVDIIKVMAMYMVICAHCNRGSVIAPSNLMFIVQCLSMASVPLFLMSSGYLLYDRDVNWGYVIRKIWKILRFCYILVFAYMIAAFVVKGTIQYEAFLCLLQKGYFWNFWYFGALILIYLILPYIIKILHSDRILLWMIILTIFDSGVYLCNIMYNFEPQIIQTFRMWDWLLYFCWGGVTFRYKHRIGIACSGILMVFFALSFIFSVHIVHSVNNHVIGEYHYPSLFCVSYCLSLFIFISNLNVKGNLFLAVLSGLFLPIYTLHPTLIKVWSFFVGRVVDVYGWQSFAFHYFGECLFTTIVCFLLMKIKIINMLFKI